MNKPTIVRKVNINNNSVEGAGLTSDYKQAICEYIWNGFDANASKINIDYQSDELGNITFFSIKDNGIGIDFNNLDNTFGAFLDSVKRGKSYQRSSDVKGKRGKGRYSFKCISNEVIWHTIFKYEDKYIEYDISIRNNDKDQFRESADKSISKLKSTGTSVFFEDIHSLYLPYLESDAFHTYLLQEFSWFLVLNREKGYSIELNGKSLNYKEIISDTASEELIVDYKDQSTTFNVTYIRWTKEIGEKYYFYLLDSLDYEKAKILTSFNNKNINFYHSVYVTSNFFDDFYYNEKLSEKETSEGLWDKDQSHPVFKQLHRKLIAFLENKQKLFIRDTGAEELISRYKRIGIITNVTSEYLKIKQDDLISTIKEIYCIQPKIFIGLRNEQEKTLVGFLDLLLDTEERENVLFILDGIVKMTKKERESLANTLKVTELSKITNLIKLLEDRYRVYYALKEAINNESLNVLEVPDLQQMIENSFWIFGEQYNIVTAAEPDFEEALRRFRHLLTGENKKTKIDHIDKNKEMDLFAVRQNPLINTIENIVIELKRPNLLLGEGEVSQVKNYMRVILSKGEFNASNMSWSFYLIGKKFNTSGYIEGEMETNTHHGEPYLIFKNTKGIPYKIYVKKWSEVFTDFELRHKFLNDKLALKRKLLLANAQNKEELHQITSKGKQLSQS